MWKACEEASEWKRVCKVHIDSREYENVDTLYGVMGFVFGAIGALIYNLVAKWVGGFELELELQPPGPRAPYPIVPPPTPIIHS